MARIERAIISVTDKSGIVDFAKALSHYLADYLPGQRNVSANTVKSYRDTFKLFCTTANRAAIYPLKGSV